MIHVYVYCWLGDTEKLDEYVVLLVYSPQLEGI